MKQKLQAMERGERLDLGLIAGAVVLLILALVLAGKGTLSLILSVAAFLASLAALRRQLLGALQSRSLGEGPLLPAAAGILSICAGQATAAALALLVWWLGERFLRYTGRRVQTVLSSRRSFSPLREELAEPAEKPVLVRRSEQLLSGFLPYLMVLLAALAAALTALVGHGGVSAALRRSAVILALGGTMPLFASFPLSDYAAVLRAGESGVLFREDSLPRLMDLRLAAVDFPQAKTIGSAVVYPARPEAVGAELMLRLAMGVCQDTGLPVEEKLASVVRSSFPETEVSRELLPGYGVVARIRDLTVLAGSPELMKQSGLAVFPFPERGGMLHLGINGRYAGCIDFGEAELPEEAAGNALRSAGVFCFRDMEEAQEKRLPGEKLLLASPLPRLSGEAEDLPVSLGIPAGEASIALERCGKGGILALLEQLNNAILVRKGTVLVSVIIKAVLLLLAVIGACPLWVAVLAEQAAAAFNLRYALHALDLESKY